MKTMMTFFTLLGVFLGTTAMADFVLSRNAKPIVCYGEDNQSIDLNAKRTRIKYTIEGESLRSKKITTTTTDEKTYITYETSELTLTLSDEGDTFQLKDDEASQEARCH